MTVAEITNGLTQAEYERLLSGLAGAIRTKRRFITIISAERVTNIIILYKIKDKRSYYPYLIKEVFGDRGKVYFNLGLLI